MRGEILLFLELYFAIFSPLYSPTKQGKRKSLNFLSLSLPFHIFQTKPKFRGKENKRKENKAKKDKDKCCSSIEIFMAP